MIEVSRAQSTYFVWFIHKKEPSGLRANKKQNKSPYLLLREPSRPSNSSQASPPLETSDKCTGDSHSTTKYGKGLLAISIPVFCFGDPPSRPSFSPLRLVSCYRQEGPLLPHSPMLGNEEAREDGSIIASHPTLRIYLCPPQEAETRTFSSDPFCRADPKGVALTSQGNEANSMPERLGWDFRGLPPFPHSLSTCWLCPPQPVKGLTAGQGRPGPCP